MVDVEINIDDLEGIDDAVEELVRGSAVIQAIASTVHQRIVQLANERLTTTRDAYLAGLKPPVVTDEQNAVIELEGALPNYIEHGLEPYDLRTTHLKGRDRVVIPFQHGPAAGAQPFGHAFKKAAGAAVAKAVGREVAKATLTLQPGGRLPPRFGPKLKPTNAGPLYGGAQRGGGTNRYLTFRTLSNNSPSDSWQHPGVTARNLMEEASENLEELIPEILDGLLGGGGE